MLGKSPIAFPFAELPKVYYHFICRFMSPCFQLYLRTLPTLMSSFSKVFSKETIGFGSFAIFTQDLAFVKLIIIVCDWFQSGFVRSQFWIPEYRCHSFFSYTVLCGLTGNGLLPEHVHPLVRVQPKQNRHYCFRQLRNHRRGHLKKTSARKYLSVRTRRLRRKKRLSSPF